MHHNASGVQCANLNLVVDGYMDAVMRSSLVTIAVNHGAAKLAADLARLTNTIYNKLIGWTRLQQQCNTGFKALVMAFLNNGREGKSPKLIGSD